MLVRARRERKVRRRWRGRGKWMSWIVMAKVAKVMTGVKREELKREVARQDKEGMEQRKAREMEVEQAWAEKAKERRKDGRRKEPRERGKDKWTKEAKERGKDNWMKEAKERGKDGRANKAKERGKDGRTNQTKKRRKDRRAKKAMAKATAVTAGKVELEVVGSGGWVAKKMLMLVTSRTFPALPVTVRPTRQSPNSCEV
jgi:hypothetical protein